MKLSEFIYDFPKELIAQEPLRERDASRLMVLDRAIGQISERVFRGVEEYLSEGDCLVLNDTRVIPVRLYGERKTGAKVEIFLLDIEGEKLKALVRPSKRVKEGEIISLEGGFEAEILGNAEIGRFITLNAPIDKILEYGHVPLPPYISRKDNQRDKNDYQTVYSCNPGASASPTAGLHFTDKLIDRIKKKGVNVVYITLHTSYGTFAPVKEEKIEDHVMYKEYYSISEEAAETINTSKRNGGRVFAVGTTAIRVLETAAIKKDRVKACSGETGLFIYPGYDFKVVDAVITNFHLPGSTLLMLVSAFAGKKRIFEAYQKAIDLKFRFFSYGDAMLIL